MEKLKDKVCVVTGAAGGIGKATAELFLSHGAKVMLVDLTEDDLRNVTQSMNKERTATFAADVSKLADNKAITEATLSKFGRIDIAFLNAGIEGKFFPISQYPEDVFDRVIAVNLKGVWLGCQQLIPKMSQGGSVIITSSVAGLKGFAHLGAYVASKHAVVGIMKTAALEFADKGIRVNSIHPGPVNNRMMHSIEEQIHPEQPADSRKDFEANIPFVRYAENSEIADLALFLASDDSKYMTGTTQVIDGGMIIK
ncbi:SDR family NAD(P)-dependent oxidoreductase [Salinimicrobium sediminilitoris]|uniref:SDR family NAD(P)-dependent oxidoreductase n=1 Tax=Salinimicrobium sediminilitoris TaxID=2876715 RepID=UPI001E4A8C7C|nr:SDR family NAD(P)-dependent oxidoreductase [Salinimicrobium sediminilitoris]MCC8360687.1 SDR family oxidoreductase [Salinimicrobium sediminilitoris]